MPLSLRSTLTNKGEFCKEKNFLNTICTAWSVYQMKLENLGISTVALAFAFENHMQSLKKLLRSGKRPIIQILKQLSEIGMKDMPLPESDWVSINTLNNCYVLNESSCCEAQKTSNRIMLSHN